MPTSALIPSVASANYGDRAAAHNNAESYIFYSQNTQRYFEDVTLATHKWVFVLFSVDYLTSKLSCPNHVIFAIPTGVL